MEVHATTPEPTATPAGGELDKPSGPIAAVLLATGIGALVLGILTVWAEASETFKDSLAYDLEVGSLSGKTIWASAGFFVSWGVLHLALRRREVDLRKVVVVMVILLAVAYLMTFAPFFQLFVPEE